MYMGSQHIAAVGLKFTAAGHPQKGWPGERSSCLRCIPNPFKQSGLKTGALEVPLCGILFPEDKFTDPVRSPGFPLIFHGFILSFVI